MVANSDPAYFSELPDFPILFSSFERLWSALRSLHITARTLGVRKRPRKTSRVPANRQRGTRQVKQLFLRHADRHGHSWFKHLDLSAVDLGKGKRQLVPNGHFVSRYQITLPMELFILDVVTMASEVLRGTGRPTRPCIALCGD